MRVGTLRGMGYEGMVIWWRLMGGYEVCLVLNDCIGSFASVGLPLCLPLPTEIMSSGRMRLMIRSFPTLRSDCKVYGLFGC